MPALNKMDMFMNKNGSRPFGLTGSYTPPRLTVYGSLTKLTAAGTGTSKEQSGSTQPNRKP